MTGSSSDTAMGKAIDPVIDPAVVAEATAVIERYFAALNARDPEAVRATLHFPHVRINAAGAMTHFPDRSADFLANFTGRVSGDGWDRSVLDGVDVHETQPRKAHLTIRFRRFRADGGVIGAYRSLYVVTCHDGRWGIQAGSGDS